MDQEQKDRQIAVQLFGSCKKLAITGPHQPSVSQLAELAVAPKAELGAVNIFCVACGSVSHLTQAGGEALASMAGIAVPTDWNGKYFQLQRCDYCSDEFEKPELELL